MLLTDTTEFCLVIEVELGLGFAAEYLLVAPPIKKLYQNICLTVVRILSFASGLLLLEGLCSLTLLPSKFDLDAIHAPNVGNEDLRIVHHLPPLLVEERVVSLYPPVCNLLAPLLPRPIMNEIIFRLHIASEHLLNFSRRYANQFFELFQLFLAEISPLPQ